MFPGAGPPLGDLEGIRVEGVGGCVTYVLAPEVAALRRMLVVDAPERRLEELLDAVGLRGLAAEPSADERARHARALSLGRMIPGVAARWWLDGDVWPPAEETLAAEEASLEDPRSEVRVEEHPLLGLTALASSALFGARSRLESLIMLRRRAEGVVSILRGGAIARRWRVLADAVPDLEGTSAVEDLAGGGAAFSFARLLPQWRTGGGIGPGFDYAVRIDPALLERLDRFCLLGDRYGSANALVDAISDRELEDRIDTGTLPAVHELLVADGIEPDRITAVICRNEAARDALLERLDGAARAGSAAGITTAVPITLW